MVPTSGEFSFISMCCGLCALPGGGWLAPSKIWHAVVVEKIVVDMVRQWPVSVSLSLSVSLCLSAGLLNTQSVSAQRNLGAGETESPPLKLGGKVETQTHSVSSGHHHCGGVWVEGSHIDWVLSGDGLTTGKNGIGQSLSHPLAMMWGAVTHPNMDDLCNRSCHYISLRVCLCVCM